MTRVGVFALGLFGLSLLTWLAYRTGGTVAAIAAVFILGLLLGWLFRLAGEWSAEAEYERRIDGVRRERDRFRHDSEDLEFRVARLEKKIASRNGSRPAREPAPPPEPAPAPRRSERAERADPPDDLREVEQLKERIALRARSERRDDSRRPEGAPDWWLPAPDGEPNDLTAIRGIGPVLSDMLNLVGVFHYRQVARFTRRDVKWIAGRIRGFPGRAAMGRWRRQARDLEERAAITIPPAPRLHRDRPPA